MGKKKCPVCGEGTVLKLKKVEGQEMCSDCAKIYQFGEEDE